MRLRSAMMFLKSIIIFALVPCIFCFSLESNYEQPPLPINPRIIGGTEVRDRCSPPYDSMAAIRFPAPTGSVVVCSAVMLTDQILVTTGFCMFAYLGQTNILGEIVIGERDLAMVDSGEHVREIESFKIHASFNITTLDNNIALIRLAEPAQLSNCVKPAIKMETDPNACEDIDDSCIMVGWGPFAENTQPTNSRLPREAPITVYDDLISGLLAQQQLNVNQPIGSVFAESRDPRMKSCQLDWGGVISCQRNNYHVLKGLIGDHNCGLVGDFPTTVTDVTYFQPWIDRCLQNWDRCQAL